MSGNKAQTQNLPDIPSPQDIVEGKKVTQAWREWFYVLRLKVNSITANIINLVGLTGTGFVVQTGAETYANRTLIAGTNITITNPDGVAGNITIAASGGGGGNAIFVNNQTGSYTLAATDIPSTSSYRGLLVVNSTSAAVVTIPLDSSVAFPIGSEETVVQEGTGATSFYSVSGVTLVGPTITAGGKGASGKIIKIATDTWAVSGQISYAQGATYQSTILADTPLLFYMLNETSGTVASNLGSMAAANGTYTGGYTLNQATGRGSLPIGVSFDGISGCVITGSISLNAGLTAYSSEFWIIPRDITTVQRIYDFANMLSSDFSSGNFDVIFHGAVQLTTAAPAINPPSAYHIVTTTDSSGTKVYINNVLVASNANVYANTLYTQPYYICRYYAGSYFTNCLMAGHAFYGYALTATQVATHYNAGI